MSYLPALAGIRPNNTILAGGTRKFGLGSTLAVSGEGYRRFFPDGADYSEFWMFVGVERMKHFTPAVFILTDGEAKSFAIGGRFSP
ncbi:MAG: hypothetical protein G01um101424_72 [Parcubacteria group bacterium Gr01-1014_24]|nr:MAG: hypothetical protein G01um101424_72 [Parcubacteria group bacterium Gr01-1014_24]